MLRCGVIKWSELNCMVIWVELNWMLSWVVMENRKWRTKSNGEQMSDSWNQGFNMIEINVIPIDSCWYPLQFDFVLLVSKVYVDCTFNGDISSTTPLDPCQFGVQASYFLGFACRFFAGPSQNKGNWNDEWEISLHLEICWIEINFQRFFWTNWRNQIHLSDDLIDHWFDWTITSARSSIIHHP